MTMLTEDWLRQTAGSTIFARGMAYHRQGAVERLSRREGRIEAIVVGNERYKVMIRASARSLSCHCSCPYGEEFSGICKHIVAAGLAVLADNSAPTAVEDEVAVIETWLSTLDRPALIGLVLRQLTDYTMLDSLLRQARGAAAAHDETVLRQLWRSQLEQALEIDDSVDYDEADGWSEQVLAIIEDMETALLPRHPDLARELALHALDELEEALDRIDDSNGGCSVIARVGRDPSCRHHPVSARSGGIGRGAVPRPARLLAV